MFVDLFFFFCKFLAKSVVYSNKLKKIEKKMEHVSRILNKSKAFGTEDLFIFNWTSRHLLWWSKLFAQVQTVAVNRQRVIFLIRFFFLLQLRRKSCLRPPARCYQNIKRHKNIFFSFFFSFFHLSFLKKQQLFVLVKYERSCFILILSDLGNIPHCCTNPFWLEHQQTYDLHCYHLYF